MPKGIFCKEKRSAFFEKRVKKEKTFYIFGKDVGISRKRLTLRAKSDTLG